MGRRKSGKPSRAARVLKLLLALWAAGAVCGFMQLMGEQGPDWDDPEALALAAEAAVDGTMQPALTALLLVCALWAAGLAFIHSRPKRRIRRLSQGTRAITPDEFFRLRNGGGTRGRSEVLARDFPGIYILTNEDRGMCYVGQATQVMWRVNQHLTGKGNGDVYADYMQGDRFRIRMIALAGSGYRDLDAMERDAIACYHAYDEGYNKTRGNRLA